MSLFAQNSDKNLIKRSMVNPERRPRKIADTLG